MLLLDQHIIFHSSSILIEECRQATMSSPSYAEPVGLENYLF